MPRTDIKKQTWLIATAALIYVILGLSAALVISDEFDHERAVFTAFFAVPVATLFIAVAYIHPQSRLKFPRTFWAGAALTVISFSWGYALLLNAISEDQQGVVVATRVDPKRVLDLNQNRGGFGHLYRWRL